VGQGKAPGKAPGVAKELGAGEFEAEEPEAEEPEAEELGVEEPEAGKAAASPERVVEWLQRAQPRASQELARLRVFVYKRNRLRPAE
jgi:hypothetical protein